MGAPIDHMPDRAAREPTTPSAGGARAAGGLEFQAEVFAWWAAHVFSDTAPGLGLGREVRIDAVGCETGFPVDDVGVALTGGGFILIQAKRGMRRLDPRAADLRSAVDQLVHAMIDGLRVNGIAVRPVDETRDRLIIATNHDGSRSFDVLGTVCERLRGQPPSAPVRAAAVTDEGRTVLEALLSIVHAAWTAAVGRGPTEEELRRFLRVLGVRRFDFEDDTGADRIRAGTMLERATVPQPFNVLVGIGVKAAEKRAWCPRDTLKDAVGMPHRGGAGPALSVARPVTAWDAQRLDVHRAISADAAPGQVVPELTVYVEREHDARLRELLSAPASPVMMMVVGGSSTGKTRAAFEAVRLCVPDWSLLRPLDAADLLEQVRGGAVGPQTVLWLNEARIFLQGQPDVAVALRRLLAGDKPVVVIGTMWPEYWKELTSAPDDDPHDVNHQTRELLLHDADRVDVPEAFTRRDRAQLDRVATIDPRLAAAAAAADRDGKVVQVLAGGPELVQHYDHPADAEDRLGKAVVTAAMDARRVGCESPIGGSFLEAAALAYVDPSDRAGAPDTWFDMGLRDATRESRGIAALTGQRQAPGIGPADGYVLHDFLDQYGQLTRRAELVPATVWDALIADVRDMADRARLAQQAERRGLYRDAVDFARPAAEAGQAAAMQLLARRLAAAGHTDEANDWARRAAEAGNTIAVQLYATRLDNEGDRDGADAILRTAADNGDTSAIVALAARLDEAGKTEDAERVLIQGAEAGDTTVMQRLAEHLDEADRRGDATEWLRCAAQTGDTIAMQQLAARLDEDDEPEDAERWLVGAAEADDHFAHFVRIQLYQRLDAAGRPDDADEWLRRDMEAGETSSLVVLASRVEQAGNAVEAAELRQRALEAGEYMVLQPALQQITQAGGTLADFENLLRGPAEAGDLFAMRTLAEQFDAAGRGPEADQWLADMGDEGNVYALHVLMGRLYLAHRDADGERVWRRILETGNSAALENLAQRLDQTDPQAAENLRRYGIEPGGATAAPW
jgi:hypothetical protein